MSILQRGAARLKSKVNYLLDRVIDLCNEVLVIAERCGQPIQGILQRTARAAGDLAWFLRELPRLSAYRLRNEAWCIIFVGERQGCLEIQKMFFKEGEGVVEEIGRYPVMKLAAQADRWLNSGVDLVIAETGRFRPWKASTPYSFVVPLWVTQIMEVPDDPEILLKGNRMRDPRRRIHHALQNGFETYHTRSLQDFEHFYHNMYLPFVRTRHGERALISPFKDQRDRWFKKHGLILVARNGQPVAGELVYRARNVCHGIEMGVLNSDPELIKLGINALVTWGTILWTRQQNARYLSLGGSHGWCENGPFNFKSLWKAKVTRRWKMYPTWTFMGRDLPEALQNRLNQIGFITEAGEKFYRVLLVTDNDKPETHTEAIANAVRKGLAGIALIRPGKTTVYLEGEIISEPDEAEPELESP